MSENLDRRNFIKLTGVASLGAALLASSNGVASVLDSNNTPEGYNPYSDFSNDLRTSSLEKSISVSGKILSKSGLTPQSNALVEVWHLDTRGRKFSHKAKVETDAQGRYKFITNIPGKEDGKARQIAFRVSSKNNSYFTELLIGDEDAHVTSKHWEKNNMLGNGMFPQRKRNSNHIEFDLCI